MSLAVCLGEARSRRKPRNRSLRLHYSIGLGSCLKWKGLEIYTMKSQRHPAMPRIPSMPAKIPAAINPEKPVARICAQYKSAMRVATSLRV